MTDKNDKTTAIAHVSRAILITGPADDVRSEFRHGGIKDGFRPDEIVNPAQKTLGI